jgi:subtilisin family serine protease
VAKKAHEAGIVGARANNGIGIAGVANCKLHVWKVFADPLARGLEEEFDDEAYNQALAAVLDSPARIVNLSLGGSGACSATYQNAVNDIVGAGALLVVAAGNSNADVNNSGTISVQDIFDFLAAYFAGCA